MYSPVCLFMYYGWALALTVVVHSFDQLPLNAHSLKQGIATHQLAVHCHNPLSFPRTSTHPRCDSKVCMALWTEHFPIQWMETSKYHNNDDPRNITLQAPSYSPFDNIQCDVVTPSSGHPHSKSVINRLKTLLHQNTKNSKAKMKYSTLCSCTMPADTPDRMYTLATHHHVVAFGDSTMRNFISFYHDIIRDAATMLPVSVLFPLTFRRKQVDVNQLPMNQYRAVAHRTMRGGPITDFVEAMFNQTVFRGYITKYGKYQIAHPALCPLGSGNNNNNNNNNNIEIPFEEWVRESYEELGDPAIQYEAKAQHACAHADPDNVIVFVLTAGLHYIPRHQLASAYRYLRYEYDIARAFQQLIRGVLSIQGCFERTVFVWKSPNILDYHGDGEMATKFDFPSIASCVQQGEAEFLKYQNCSASATDIRTMENVCSRFHFNANASNTLHQLSSEVIHALNHCLFGHHDPDSQQLQDSPDDLSSDAPPRTEHVWRNWSSRPWEQDTSTHRFIDENFVSAGESFICPAELKQAHLAEQESFRFYHTDSNMDSSAAGVNDNIKQDNNSAPSSGGAKQSVLSTVGGILIFPGAILTKYFAASGLHTDWKHYGFPLHAVFLRAIQGLVKEHMTERDLHIYADDHHKNLMKSCLNPLCSADKPYVMSSVRRLSEKEGGGSSSSNTEAGAENSTHMARTAGTLTPQQRRVARNTWLLRESFCRAHHDYRSHNFTVNEGRVYLGERMMFF